MTHAPGEVLAIRHLHYLGKQPGNKETLNKKNTTYVSGREIKWRYVINWIGMATLDWMPKKGICQLLSTTVIEGQSIPKASGLLSFIVCGLELNGL